MHQTINSQLVFGKIISEEFSEIMNELNYDFNQEGSLFFKIGTDTVLGITAPHEEHHNTQENILYEYSTDFQQQLATSYNETCEELSNQLKKLRENEKLSDDDYYLIKDEMQELKEENAHIFLFATHVHS